MKRLRLMILVGLIFYSGMSLSQEIYRWVDEKGIIHFADDITLVPEKYRDQVQKRKPPEIPSPTPAKPSEGPATTETTQPKPERKDLIGRGEEWWRAKMKEWNDKLSNAQKNYDLAYAALKTKEKELKDSIFKPDRIERKIKSEIKELEGKLKAHEREREEAKNMVEKVLPKEAEDYKADPAWLKPKD